MNNFIVKLQAMHYPVQVLGYTYFYGFEIPEDSVNSLVCIPIM